MQKCMPMSSSGTCMRGGAGRGQRRGGMPQQSQDQFEAPQESVSRKE